MDGSSAAVLAAFARAGLGPDVVRPGGLALLVVLGLVVATALLLRSMTKHLRRIDFDESKPAPDPDGAAAAESPPPAEPDK